MNCNFTFFFFVIKTLTSSPELFGMAGVIQIAKVPRIHVETVPSDTDCTFPIPLTIGLNGKFLRFRRDGPFFEALSYM
jgi:hypothetical protein